MNCPYCETADNKVIDSRPSKHGIVVRRRRQCLACSSRFTTYESTEEQLLPFFIRKKMEYGSPVTNIQVMLSFLSDTLKILSKETGNLIKKIEGLEKAQAVEVAKKEARERRAANRKAASLLVTTTVLNIIRRHKKGVHISKLRDKTGFGGSKIQNIVYNLKKQGQIKSCGKGMYVKK